MIFIDSLKYLEQDMSIGGGKDLTRKPFSSTRVEIGAKTDNLDLVRSTA